MAIYGATGLAGRAMLSVLKANTLPNLSNVVAVTRRPLDPASIYDFPLKVTNSVVADISDPNAFPENADILYCALGLPIGLAGSSAGQRAVDHDLTLKIAENAKAVGTVKTVILVSAMYADINARTEHNKMKAETERDIANLGFEQTIILRPGGILGDRVNQSVRPGYEKPAYIIFKAMRQVPFLRSLSNSISVWDYELIKAALYIVEKGDKGVTIIPHRELAKMAQKYDEFKQAQN
ncbi:uncharacterized protein V1516DRAFT_661655 [Lipomyces oligophaga]|uniref:uncharacterized protein n=1 Tax=Lipomyces oligophaga TaxID=45792 RepID=UPI0034CD8935